MLVLLGVELLQLYLLIAFFIFFLYPSVVIDCGCFRNTDEKQ